ncbi:zinc/manganese transport system substrate-binding protein [Rhizobiales bacterium GAS188]|nr:zinc/manganese transport system substrate-binding protein [Rhizobiales bacterium GAS188]
MRTRFALALLATLAVLPARAQTNPASVPIVAAENFYGDIVQQLAGDHAKVTSILSNPDEDPHLFEASPSVARDLASARIVVYNGVDYDPWMAKLLSASKAPGRHVIVVGELLHKKTGVNPHLWYDPPTAPALAKAVTAALVAEDPAHKADYEQHLQAFIASLKPIETRIAELRKLTSGVSVTATEPVFGYMSAALGFKMRNERFQLAVMNNTEPSASDVAAFESDLKNKRVKLFIYNSQATDTAAQRLLQIAKDNQIPVVGVTETQPQGKSFQEWILGELDAVQKALAGGA